MSQGARRISVRSVRSETWALACEKGKVRPPSWTSDEGTMVTVAVDGGLGYAAAAGAADQVASHLVDTATGWAQRCAASGLFQGLSVDDLMPLPDDVARWASPDHGAGDPTADWAQWLGEESRALGADARIIHHRGELRAHDAEHRVTIDGQPVAEQRFHWTWASLEATANHNGLTQCRSLAGQYGGFAQQGGRRVLDQGGFFGAGARIADEAIQLVMAAPCPTGRFDILLMPDQMMLQIHESIGHPLELDRILGDERNFAGGSFVKPEMFGSYRYGSDQLNVSYDPNPSGGGGQELVSFAADCWGTAAKRALLIEGGLLKRPLGGHLSAMRLRKRGVPIEGVANGRACSWNRPPIDRMANLNVEPGSSSLAELITSIDDGVLMATNRSWSIDDRRNSFQFGCEWGRRIRNGALAEVVRDPSYRGTSAEFWRSLRAVGDRSTTATMGLLSCGKGEPNQMVTVGHRSPACVFADVEVFGGAA